MAARASTSSPLVSPVLVSAGDVCTCSIATAPSGRRKNAMRERAGRGRFGERSDCGNGVVCRVHASGRQSELSSPPPFPWDGPLLDLSGGGSAELWERILAGYETPLSPAEAAADGRPGCEAVRRARGSKVAARVTSLTDSEHDGCGGAGSSREDDGVLLGDWDEDVESWDDLGTENSDRDLHRAAQSLAASPSTKIKTPGAAAVADVSPAGSVLSPIRRAVADPLPPLPAHTLEEHEELLPSPFLADNVDAQELKDAMKALEQRREAEARGSGDGDCGAPEPQDDANADAGDPPPATMGGDVDDNLARMFHECVNISADGRMAESRSC